MLDRIDVLGVASGMWLNTGDHYVSFHIKSDDRIAPADRVHYLGEQLEIVEIVVSEVLLGIELRCRASNGHLNEKISQFERAPIPRDGVVN